MKLLLVLLLTVATTAHAQDDYSAVIYQGEDPKLAMKTSDIDSIKFMTTTAVDPTLYTVTNKSRWKDKRIIFLGNSITEYAEYVNAYAELTGCTALNYGVGGTHMAKIDANTTNAFETRAASLPTRADMVVVFGGTNDFGHTNTAEFGEFSDGTKADRYTFYAGLHRLFSTLVKRFRLKPIVIMTPVHHGTEIDVPEYIINSDGTITEGKNPKTGKTFREYVDAIKEVAAYYSIIVLDAYSYSRLSPMTELGTSRYFFRDGLHLSERGGQRLAKWMYPQLEMVYDMFY